MNPTIASLPRGDARRAGRERSRKRIRARATRGLAVREARLTMCDDEICEYVNRVLAEIEADR